jgi:single-stranded-DNA-specific exonuclease
VQGDDIFDCTLAVVHPQLDDHEFPNICSTAVIWKLVQVMGGMNSGKKSVVKAGAATGKGVGMPEEYIDLVALATVCDVMPLVNENRDIVSEGIKYIKQNKTNKGLQEIMKYAQIDKEIFDSYHFGFVIGPRLNAAGRMDHALNGVRLFTSNNPEQISTLALKLQGLNIKRQELTEEMLKESQEDAEKQIKEGHKLIFVSKENWSEGIVGLIAGRLNEKFFLPVLAASIRGDNVKGSARSVPGFDITKAISQNENILKKFGGHNQAAGFSLAKENLEKFIENMHSIAKKDLADDMILKQIEVDMDLGAGDINIDLLENILSKFKPFGFGNNEPVFAIRNVTIIMPPILMGTKGQHLKFSVQAEGGFGNGNGAGNGGLGTGSSGYSGSEIASSIIEVVVFNRADKFFDIINLQKRYDIAGTLGINEWRGNKTIQFKLKELIQLD